MRCYYVGSLLLIDTTYANAVVLGYACHLSCRPWRTSWRACRTWSPRCAARERGMGERQSVDGFGPQRRLERVENRVIRVPPSFPRGEARAGT